MRTSSFFLVGISVMFFSSLFTSDLFAQYVKPIPPPKVYKPYVPPAQSSAGAKYEYEKTHNPPTDYNRKTYTPPKDNSTYKPNRSSLSDNRVIKKITPASEGPSYKFSKKQMLVEGRAIVSRKGEYGNLLYGFVNEKNEVVIPLIYAWVYPFKNGTAVVNDLNHSFLIDKEGNEVTKEYYNFMNYFEEDMAQVLSGTLKGFIDRSGNAVIPPQYGDTKAFSEGFAGVQIDIPGQFHGGLWGFIDKNGATKIPFNYTDVQSFSEGLAGVELNKKWSFIDKTGKEVTSPIYDDVHPFKEGLASVKQDGKWGFINKNGKMVIPFKYDYAGNFKEHVVSVFLNKKVGFINKLDSLCIPFLYEDASDFNEGIAGVRIGLNGPRATWGFIDVEGKVIVPIQYNQIVNFKDGRGTIIHNEKYLFFDRNGKEVGELDPVPVWEGIKPKVQPAKTPEKKKIPTKIVVPAKGAANKMQSKKPGATSVVTTKVQPTPNRIEPVTTKTYDATKKFHEGMAVVSLNHKYGFIDSAKVELTPLIYDFAYDFSDGMGGVKKDDKFGFVNSKGKLIIPVKYDAIFVGYAYGLAAVKLNGKWGFIDKKGATMIPFNYEETMIFNEGFVPVKQNGKWGYIDTKGKLIVPLKYDGASSFFDGVAIVKLNGKYGIVNEKGAEVIPAEYDDTYGFIDGKLRMIQNGQSVYFDKTGKKLD